MAITPTITNVEPATDDYQWVAFSEAVAITGLSTATVYRRVREGVFLKDADGTPTRYGIPSSYVIRATAPTTKPTKRESIAGRPANQDTDSRDSQPDYQEPNADSRGSQPDYQEPNADSRGSQPDYQEPNADSRGSQPDYQEPNADSRGSQPDYQEPNADSRDSQPDSNAWREDLLAQIERLEADKHHLIARVEAAETKSNADLATAETRVDSLLEAVTTKDENVSALTEQVREAHMKAEIGAQEWARRSDELAHRIADLVERQQQADARIIELQPVAEQVPMLQAAVDDRDGELEAIRSEVKRIENGAISGPIFRLLDRKRKLRR